MTNENLLREMNMAVAEEEELSVQCMWQHYMLQDTAWETVRSILMQLAINESMRVEIITQIVRCLGMPLLKKPGVCLTEKTENPLEMLSRDKERLDRIIGSYKKILLLARDEESCLLAQTFTELLVQEETHRAILGTLLAGPGTGFPVTPRR
jgi:bacterioferritin (cytochrome b1)